MPGLARSMSMTRSKTMRVALAGLSLSGSCRVEAVLASCRMGRIGNRVMRNRVRRVGAFRAPSRMHMGRFGRMRGATRKVGFAVPGYDILRLRMEWLRCFWEWEISCG